jgi:hypothetical protein
MIHHCKIKYHLSQFKYHCFIYSETTVAQLKPFPYYLTFAPLFYNFLSSSIPFFFFLPKNSIDAVLVKSFTLNTSFSTSQYVPKYDPSK